MTTKYTNPIVIVERTAETYTLRLKRVFGRSGGTEAIRSTIASHVKRRNQQTQPTTNGARKIGDVQTLPDVPRPASWNENTTNTEAAIKSTPPTMSMFRIEDVGCRFAFGLRGQAKKNNARARAPIGPLNRQRQPLVRTFSTYENILHPEYPAPTGLLRDYPAENRAENTRDSYNQADDSSYHSLQSHREDLWQDDHGQ